LAKQRREMKNQPVLRSKLILSTIFRLIFFAILWGVVFFLPAGTFAFWEAWVVLAILFIPFIVGAIYWLKVDPGLAGRRAKTAEKEPGQKSIVKFLYLFFFLMFLIPGFDKRFAWSNVPVYLVIIADVLLMLGYGICFYVVTKNRFAGRTIEVEADQPVISDGLNAIVRHPMYLGITLMCVAFPLALGSWWAMIPAMLVIPVLVGRIQNEERMLVKELKGYPEYMQKTKYRLFPGIW
jgi:protein-S-isoprenylcysteine O-methyltransferase Ste14